MYLEILTSFPPRVWLRSSHASSAADEDSNVTKTNGRRSLVSRSSGAWTSSTCQLHSQIYTKHYIRATCIYYLHQEFSTRGKFQGFYRGMEPSTQTVGILIVIVEPRQNVSNVLVSNHTQCTMETI